MSEEFIVSVFLQGSSGLRYNDEEYSHPPFYIFPSIQNVTLTDYRKKPSTQLERLFGLDANVEEIIGEFQDAFNQPAKLVIWETEDELILALYDTHEEPTKRFLIHTDQTNEIGIYDYHWEYFNWLSDEEFTYMAVFNIPN